MAKRKKQRPKQAQTKQTLSAYEQYQKIALDEARLVPWPQLMQFVEDSLRWEEFVASGFAAWELQ